jgi:Ca-activated chloride channel family protein
MRLAYPWLLLLLLVVPVYVLARVLAYRKRAFWFGTFQFGNFSVLRSMTGGWRSRLWWLPEFTRLAVLAVVVVALARPQTEDFEVLSGKGVDIMLALDMSGSMNLVDRSPQEIQGYLAKGEQPPNRFHVAIDTLKELVRNRKGDRVGLVIFGAQAFLKFPLTLDRDMALRQLEALILDDGLRDRQGGTCRNNCTIPGEATAVGDALAKAFKRIEKSDGKGKVIILVTDGNDNASQLAPMDVARHIGALPERDRPRLYVFLVGQGNLTHRPVYEWSPFDPAGRTLRYERTEEPVDESALQALTEAAGGTFRVSHSEEEFRQAFSDLQRSEYVENRVARHKDLFPLWLWVALALAGVHLILDTVVLRRFP